MLLEWYLILAGLLASVLDLISTIDYSLPKHCQEFLSCRWNEQFLHSNVISLLSPFSSALLWSPRLKERVLYPGWCLSYYCFVLEILKEKKVSFPENFSVGIWKDLEAKLDCIFCRRSVDGSHRGCILKQSSSSLRRLELPKPSIQPRWSEEARLQNHPVSMLCCVFFLFWLFTFVCFEITYTEKVFKIYVHLN